MSGKRRAECYRPKVKDELLGPLSYARSIQGIDKTQAVSLEAIGFAIDAVDVVYRRLTTYLRDRLPLPTIVFADAWAMIDWMHRLDGLVEGCRGLTQRPAVGEIMKVRAWLPAPPNAVYPGIAERVR